MLPLTASKNYRFLETGRFKNLPKHERIPVLKQEREVYQRDSTLDLFVEKTFLIKKIISLTFACFRSSIKWGSRRSSRASRPNESIQKIDLLELEVEDESQPETWRDDPVFGIKMEDFSVSLSVIPHWPHDCDLHWSFVDDERYRMNVQFSVTIPKVKSYNLEAREILESVFNVELGTTVQGSNDSLELTFQEDFKLTVHSLNDIYSSYVASSDVMRRRMFQRLRPVDVELSIDSVSGNRKNGKLDSGADKEDSTELKSLLEQADLDALLNGLAFKAAHQHNQLRPSLRWSGEVTAKSNASVRSLALDDWLVEEQQEAAVTSSEVTVAYHSDDLAHKWLEETGLEGSNISAQRAAAIAASSATDLCCYVSLRECDDDALQGDDEKLCLDAVVHSNHHHHHSDTGRVATDCVEDLMGRAQRTLQKTRSNPVRAGLPPKHKFDADYVSGPGRWSSIMERLVHSESAAAGSEHAAPPQGTTMMPCPFEPAVITGKKSSETHFLSSGWAEKSEALVQRVLCSSNKGVHRSSCASSHSSPSAVAALFSSDRLLPADDDDDQETSGDAVDKLVRLAVLAEKVPVLEVKVTPPLVITTAAPQVLPTKVPLTVDSTEPSGANDASSLEQTVRNAPEVFQTIQRDAVGKQCQPPPRPGPAAPARDCERLDVATVENKHIANLSSGALSTVAGGGGDISAVLPLTAGNREVQCRESRSRNLQNVAALGTASSLSPRGLEEPHTFSHPVSFHGPAGVESRPSVAVPPHTAPPSVAQRTASVVTDISNKASVVPLQPPPPSFTSAPPPEALRPAAVRVGSSAPVSAVDPSMAAPSSGRVEDLVEAYLRLHGGGGGDKSDGGLETAAWNNAIQRQQLPPQGSFFSHSRSDAVAAPVFNAALEDPVTKEVQPACEYSPSPRVVEDLPGPNDGASEKRPDRDRDSVSRHLPPAQAKEHEFVSRHPIIDLMNDDGLHSPTALSLLLSEDCMEEHPLLVRALQQDEDGVRYSCIDCPLQSPVSLQLDEATCVCLVGAAPLMPPSEGAQRELKGLVRSLTQIAFKYRTVWLVLMFPAERVTAERNSLLLRVCQSVSRFPNQIVLRQCAVGRHSSDRQQHSEKEETPLHRLVRSIVLQVTREQSAAHRSFLRLLDPNVVTERADGEVVTANERSVFAAHCEYLQLFPTLNFYLAAALLSTWTLRELVTNLRAYTRQKQTHRVFAQALVQILRQRDCVFREDSQDALLTALEQFFVLLTAHAGLMAG